MKRVIRIGSIVAGAVLATIANAQARYPNDPYFADQASFRSAGTRLARVSSRSTRRLRVRWGPLAALDLPAAWALSTGSAKIIVALLDDGFFYAHPDIAPNLWRNPGESGVDSLGRRRDSNEVDDDGNGFVDDVLGWDFPFDDPDPDPYVFDGMSRDRIQPYWHSASALGIIGARGNNGIGIAGINWNVSLMLLKIGAQGIPRGQLDSARAGRAARAIRYAADNGARVINWSGLVSQRTATASIDSLRDAVRYADSKGVLLVVAAGNDGASLDDDARCFYPQCFDEPNILRVAQVDSLGSLYRYQAGDQWRGSNFGVTRVEISAPGEHFAPDVYHNIDTYDVSNGTSSAGPVVSGVAALVLSIRPSLRVDQLKSILLASARHSPALRGFVQEERVINPAGALRLARRTRADIGRPSSSTVR